MKLESVKLPDNIWIFWDKTNLCYVYDPASAYSKVFTNEIMGPGERIWFGFVGRPLAEWAASTCGLDAVPLVWERSFFERVYSTDKCRWFVVLDGNKQHVVSIYDEFLRREGI